MPGLGRPRVIACERADRLDADANGVAVTLTLRRGKLRASGDVQVQGQEIDAESGSPPETGLDLTVGGRVMASFDPQCSLIVALDPTLLQRILDAGTTHGRPVSFHLKITAHPRDAKGIARVVGELEKPALK
jgi:hypothetical protein